MLVAIWIVGVDSGGLVDDVIDDALVGAPDQRNAYRGVAVDQVAVNWDQRGVM